MGDWELLQEYAKRRSESAFAELVQRHLNWVYSSALRQVNDPQLAKDVTQSVFILLARKAGQLRSGTVVSGWLFRTTHFVASRALRGEYRCKAREQQASAMISTANLPDNQIPWEQLRPHLDQAVAALSKTDRTAILLRFYEKKTLREVGEQLGISEDAAKKRVARTIEKLRKFLSRRGVVLGGTGLVVLMAEQTVHAAPAVLAVTVLKAATASASASAVLPQLARETLNAWRLARLKWVAGFLAVFVAGVVLTTNTRLKHERDTVPPTGVAAPLRAAGSRIAPTPPPESHATTEQALTTRRSISIHVVEVQSKQPLAGVEIKVREEDQPTNGRTDEEGRYQVELPENDPPNLSVTAHKDGFVPMVVYWNTQDGTFRLPQEFTLTLEQATSIGGIVRDEQGQPISGASVFITLRGSNMAGATEEVFVDIWHHKVVTDGLGRWRFDQAPADLNALQIQLSHPDYVNTSYPGYPDNANLPDEKLRSMTAEMVMKRGLTVSGAVFDVQGRPIPGAFVGLGRSRPDVGFSHTTTDSMGAFRFNSVKSGKTMLFVQAHGHAPDLKSIEVGKDSGPFEFRLEPGHALRGLVVDEQGNPLPGVHVLADEWRDAQFLSWRTTTDTNGAFEWADAPADDVQFSFLKEGYRRLDDFALSPNSTNNVVTLRPPFIARGSVTDAQTGQPIASFRVTAGRLDKDQQEPYWMEDQQRSFSGGQYQWNAEFSGRYLLRVEAEGYAAEISPPFDQDGESFAYDFKLTRAAWIQGVVRTPDGQPAANVEVFLVTPGQPLLVENGIGQAATSVRTGNDGRFGFSPPGKPFLVVALHDKGYAQAASERAGTLPDLLLRPWARIDGTMYIGSRAAVRQTVNLGVDGVGLLRFNDQPGVSFVANTMTDDTGHFLLDHVPAAEVYLGSTHEVYLGSTHSVQLHLHPDFGQTAHVTIGGTGRPVVGQLVAPAGFDGKVDWNACNPNSLHTKLPQLPKSMLPNDWASMTTERKQAWYYRWKNAWNNSDEGRAYWKTFRAYYFAIHPDGSFRVEDVEPGTYQFEIALGSEPRTNGTSIVQQPVAWLKHEFTVPEMPEGRSDEPLDLGDLELQPVPQQP